MPTTRQLAAALNPTDLVRRIEELEQRVERLEADAAPLGTRRTAKKAASAANE